MVARGGWAVSGLTDTLCLVQSIVRAVVVEELANVYDVCRQR